MRGISHTLHILIAAAALAVSGCTTTTTVVEDKPFDSVFDVKSNPAPPPKKNPEGMVKQAVTGTKVFGATAASAAGSAARGVGGGASWVAGEFMRPLNSLREGMIDTFGVAEKAPKK
ncbi:MAG TPA: hypothetical protein P5287_01780 [bacterium]|nr:hypothetical protein [bacterium]